ncbi:unnamed protein product [Thlaspi arvense]|uniref:Uncharacterized protein n=1 Tax=Thlaspi arvense TaxID=13288 RepID=A0AAU9S2B8_THLAR|nr:unnamed protein product [Thlaspi arvense]
MAKGWGRTVVIGMEMQGAPLTLNSYELLRGKTIVGSMFGGIKAKTDIPILAKKYMNKVLKLLLFLLICH